MQIKEFVEWCFDCSGASTVVNQQRQALRIAKEPISAFREHWARPGSPQWSKNWTATKTKDEGQATASLVTKLKKRS
jgi:hypothetical protein